MIGMGAMVGGATGAAMTAVTMIFEMTRDYGIVLPMILAVAVALGVRRMLSRENIYTLKLARRGHTIPKALQANMFLVRKAKEVMERNVIVVPADLGLNAFLLQPDHGTGMQHIVVANGDRLVGVVRINTAFRHGIAEAGADIAFGDVATRDFTLARRTMSPLTLSSACGADTPSWRLSCAAMAVVDIARRGQPMCSA